MSQTIQIDTSYCPSTDLGIALNTPSTSNGLASWQQAGRGSGKGRGKRHRRILRENINGITKGAIRRLARRGGVRRISALIYPEARDILKVFLENIIRDAVTYTEYAKRKVVTALDVVFALKQRGVTIYGFSL